MRTVKTRRGGVLFDLDGVLIDSEQAHYEATRQAFAALGLPHLSPDLYQELMLGRPDREAIADGLAALELPADLLEPLLARKAEIYQTLLQEGAVRFLPDGLATLEAALAAQVPTAVVTGALRAEAIWALRAAGVIARIQALIASEDVRQGKPNPEPYLVGCRTLAVEPRLSVAVEDSPAGVAAARAAGLRVLAVARRSFPELTSAHRVVPTLDWEDIRALLDSES